MPADPARTCPECGTGLPTGTAAGQCPNCLLGLGLAGGGVENGGQTEAAAGQRTEDGGQKPTDGPTGASGIANRQSPIGHHLGDYELLEEIGRGGMGVVYKARQQSLDRIVALKLLLFGPHAPPESVKRFRAEAVATAALQHPNIVPIHEVGLCEGQHFLVMDFVEGPSLAKVISDFGFRISDFKRPARWVKAIAEAIHYAHERGILHRDLKPFNILIDANDQPRVTDFGLAKRLEGDSELTVSGQVLGSPNYMPPEQATGRRGTVSRRSDVYALGAILYHAMTGRPPFVGEGLAETVQQVLHAEPVSPRVLNPRLPADLETVCLKCLEKEPAKRYATAQLLAEELGRFLEGKPVLARPVGRLAKAWRWCRRNPRLAWATGAALLSLLVGLAGVTWQWHRAESLRARAELNLYAADISLAYHYLKDGYSSQARDLLARHGSTKSAKSEIRNPKSETDQPAWDWRYLWSHVLSDAEFVLDQVPRQCRIDLSRDGRFLAVASADGRIHLWDLAAPRMVALVGQGSLSPAGIYASLAADGQFLGFAESGGGQPPRAAVWDVDAKARRAELVDTNFTVLLPLAFVPGSPTVVVGRVAASDRARSLALWDFQTGQIAATYAVSKDPFQRYGSLEFPFTPDGSCFVCGEMDGRVRILDSKTLELRGEFPAHENPVSALALSPDGKLLATAQDHGSTQIQLWDFERQQPLDALVGHAACVTSLSFSPYGRFLASGSADHTLRIWDVAARRETRRLVGHRREVLCVRFSPDGQRLYSSGVDGLVYVWRVDDTRRQLGPERRPLHLDDWSLSPDGRRLATVGRDGVACVYDVASGEVLDHLAGLGNDNSGVLFAADGRWLFVAKRSGDILLWNPEEQRTVRQLDDKVDVQWAERSRDGRLIIACDRSFRIHVWRTDTWQARAWQEEAWHGEVATVPCGSLSSDSRWLAIGLERGIVHVWDPLTGSLRRTLKHGEQTTRRLGFSADGRFLAAASLDASVTVWETSSWREIVRLSLPHWADSLGFSPDGRRLAIGSRAQEAIKLWDTATWRELLTLEAPGGYLWGLEFTADGNRLLGCNEAGDLLIWSAPSQEEIETAENSRKGP
jgi:WD40 repeat protein